jgi:Kef-type K+ transport system membrane component KefB
MKFGNQKTAAQQLWPWAVGLALVAVLMAFAVWFIAARLTGVVSNANRSQVTQSVVVQRVEKVAKLVSTETTLRDVVVYENTWYGSTKKALVVVTGKVMAGINLDRGRDVQINDQNKLITITLPRPEVLAIEITDLQTYDEQRGWWNPFTSADHDAIYKLARDKFAESGNELKLTETARESASELLENMFATDGYRVEVTYR